MRHWLGTVILPDGGLPLLNDCVPVAPRRLAALEPERRVADRLVVLEPSGYVVVRPGPRFHVVLDVGLPCPPELPAHAHADCLTFELCVDGRRTVVDTGTSTYTAGVTRSYERSTRAHNTVEVDGCSQTEVWGAFRAARRARPRLLEARDDADTIVVVAEHDGYRRLPGSVTHRRTWRIGPERLEVDDEVLGSGHHYTAARLHLAPGIEPVIQPNGEVRAGPLLITVGRGADIVAAEINRDDWVAGGFGIRQPAASVVVRQEGELPQRVVTTLTTYDPATMRDGSP
jgi:uncharacterized heparinase superfamily protein